MVRAAVAAIGLLFFSAPQSVALESSTLDADLRCLVASLVLVNSTDAQERQAGMGSFSYWLGRVDGAEPNLDLEERIANLSQQMTSEDIARELVRCGSELMARGQEVQRIGNRLQSRGL